MPYPLALVKPTETATTSAGRPARRKTRIKIKTYEIKKKKKNPLKVKTTCFKSCLLTPSQAQEALANDAVAQTTSDSHVGLPSFGQHPAERGEEKEMQESGYKSAHHLRDPR